MFCSKLGLQTNNEDIGEEIGRKKPKYKNPIKCDCVDGS